MNQQQFDQLQADMVTVQAQLAAATALITQQQVDLAAAQTTANQAVTDAAAAQADAVAAQANAAVAQAAANAAAGNAPVAGQALAAPPIVAVNAPGQIMGLINLGLASGLKIHKLASAPFRDLFDGQASQLTTFTNDLWTRARSFGWDHLIFSINTTTNGVVNVKALVDNYTAITMADIQAMANVYSAMLPVATRASQAATQLHLTLQDSLTPALKNRVIARKAEYTFVINGVTYEDGVAMLKVVFNLVSVDTKSTISVITRNLEYAQLAAKLVELEFDPVRFHLFVHEQILKLVQRNSPVPNIVGALFEAYKQVPDDAYTTWASQEYSTWEKPTSDDWTNEQVMEMAEVRYHTIVQKGEWKVPTKHSEEIIALTAKFDQAVANNKKRKLDPVVGSPTPRCKSNDQGKQGWKYTAPAAGESNEKTVNEKKYVHCPYHGDLQWVLKEGHVGGCNNAPKTPTTAPKAPVATPIADPTVVTAVVAALAGIVGDQE
jgi:hypothetical protein